jgi:tetratricopeptide (TPR) repeat protein
VQGQVRESNIGDSAAALASYRKALGIREKLSRLDPGDVAAKRELVPNYGKLSDLLLSTGDQAGALEYSRRLLGISEQLATAPGALLADRMRLATSYLDYGYKVGLAGGDRARGLETCRKALDAFARLIGEAPDDRRLQRVYGIALDRTAELLEKDGGALNEALGFRRKALDTKRKLLALEPGNTDYRRLVAWGMFDLAALQQRTSARQDATAGFRAAVETFRQLAAADPANAQFQKDLATAESSLAGHSH